MSVEIKYFNYDVNTCLNASSNLPVSQDLFSRRSKTTVKQKIINIYCEILYLAATTRRAKPWDLSDRGLAISCRNGRTMSKFKKEVKTCLFGQNFLRKSAIWCGCHTLTKLLRSKCITKILLAKIKPLR